MLLLPDRGSSPTSWHVTLPLFSPSLCTTKASDATKGSRRFSASVVETAELHFPTCSTFQTRLRFCGVMTSSEGGGVRRPSQPWQLFINKEFSRAGETKRCNHGVLGRERRKRWPSLLTQPRLSCVGERERRRGISDRLRYLSEIRRGAIEEPFARWRLQVLAAESDRPIFSQSESAYGWLGAKRLKERAGSPKCPIDSPCPVQALASRRHLRAQPVHLIRLTEGFLNWITVFIAWNCNGLGGKVQQAGLQKRKGEAQPCTTWTVWDPSGFQAPLQLNNLTWRFFYCCCFEVCLIHDWKAWAWSLFRLVRGIRFGPLGFQDQSQL